jgi:hypothetical protein
VCAAHTKCSLCALLNARFPRDLCAQVEIDTEVPAAEFEGIAEQMQRLDDLEGLQDDWRVQAEARDEVSRCVRVCVLSWPVRLHRNVGFLTVITVPTKITPYSTVQITVGQN